MSKKFDMELFSARPLSAAILVALGVAPIRTIVVARTPDGPRFWSYL